MPKKTQIQLLHDCLVLNTTEQVLIFPIQEILYVKASNSYTLFVEVSGKSWSISKSLRYFETNLVDLGSFRIHRSYMVNFQHFRRFGKAQFNEQGIPYNKDHVKKLIQLSEE
jgi:two-component system LytT family response regulator